jgi:hypothetical protein
VLHSHVLSGRGTFVYFRSGRGMIVYLAVNWNSVDGEADQLCCHDNVYLETFRAIILSRMSQSTDQLGD